VSEASGKMWGGRFKLPPDREFYQFQRSLRFDARLLPYELASGRAWARALVAAGLLSDGEAQQIIEALESIDRLAQENPGWVISSPAEDVHHFVEMQLVARLGEVGAKLHTGRSRNELVVCDFRMFVRDAAAEARSALVRLVAALLDQADSALGLPMPGMTHTQPAQPILLSHFLHAHAEAFLRDVALLHASAAECQECPLGSGALSGTAFPVDRQALAQELGFAGVTPNSVDAVGQRDFAAAHLFALAMSATHLSRLAADIVLFSSSGFGWVILPDEFSTGSSLMPQKKNPDAWELIRGKTGRVTGALFMLLSTLKGLPSSYQRDLQEDKEALFDAHDQAVAMLRVAAGATATMRFNEARLRQAALDPALLSTEAADYLVRRGLPFRQAHEITGKVCLEAERRGVPWTELPMETLRSFSPLFEDDLRADLNVDAALSRRDVLGGTAPGRVRKALADCRARLANLEVAQ
jgi:argininosuccinate lyase